MNIRTALPVILSDDGTWLVIESASGKSAMIRLENVMQERAPICRATFAEWSAQQRTPPQEAKP